MKPNLVRNSLAVLMIVVALGAAGLPALAGPLPRPLYQGGAPTVVSYQGYVTVVSGTPYTGEGYFKFVIVNDVGDTAWSHDGTSVGGGEPTAAVTLTVAGGLFNVLLGDTAVDGMDEPLNAAVFDGTERYLRVWFSQAGAAGTFTLLTPDRRIAAVPYALQAEEAKLAGDADTLDSYHASAFQQHYANVVVVAKSGGDYDTVTAALDSISDASDANRYLVRVMPGVYTERVTMKPYVDIEGAGELTTRITFTGSPSNNTGTLVGANDAELRFLTVENSGGVSTYAFAIYNNSSSPRLTHVTASASGGSYNYGVRNRNNSSPTMTGVTASASGGGTNYGVYNYNNSSPTMTGVTASGSGGGTYNCGVYNYNNCSPTMTDVTVTASGLEVSGNYGVYNYSSSPTMTDVTASASGGTNSRGVYNDASSSPTMTDVTASGSGGSANCGVYNRTSSPTMTDVTASASGGSYNYGVYNYSSSPTMTDVTASASGGSTNYGVYNTSSSPTISNSTLRASDGTSGNYGLYNYALSSSYTVRVSNSQVAGSTNTIYNNAQFTTYVGATLLDGEAVAPNGGTITCAGVYDEAYAFYASTCP
ncbi:MAG: hypothetical protein KKB13_13435 [Chloroflexi bacterium]|nr:hypothetical protein [Chloroflexota bacterium]